MKKEAERQYVVEVKVGNVGEGKNKTEKQSGMQETVHQQEKLQDRVKQDMC